MWPKYVGINCMRNRILV